MKKLKKYGNVLLILIIIAATVINIMSLVLRFNCENNTPLSNQSNTLQRSYGETLSTFYIDSKKFYVPTPNYIEDETVHQTMCDSVREAFQGMPDFLSNCDEYSYSVPYISDKLFSIDLNFSFTGGMRYVYYYVCFIIDVQTGKILYLNDILDLKELTALVLKGGYAHYYDLWVEFYDLVPQEHLDEYDFDMLYERFSLCSAPYNTKNFKNKSTFYIDGNRIYFVDVFARFYPHHSVFYIELDDIGHILKIDI